MLKETYSSIKKYAKHLEKEKRKDTYMDEAENYWMSAPDREILDRRVENINLNVEYHVDETSLSKEDRLVLENIKHFVENVSDKFRRSLIDAIFKYSKDERKSFEKIVNMLIANNWLVPKFTVFDKKHSSDELKWCGFSGVADPFLLNFQLPKPIAQFWYKGGNEGRSVDVSPRIFEWGRLYRNVSGVILSQLQVYQDEGLLSFNRVNTVAEHDPQKYYYLFIVSEGQNEEYNEHQE